MERAMFCVRCACGRGCHPVGGCAKLFFPPFWSRTAHIVIFRVVSPVRSVPGRTEKRHQSADAAAQKRNKNRCSERNLSHVILHGKNRGSNAEWPISIVANAARTGIASH